MPSLNWIKALLADAADDVVRWAERQFANLADTPANRLVVQRAVEARVNALPSEQPNPFTVAVERARQPAPRRAAQAPRPLMNVGLGRANRLNPTTEPVAAEDAVAAVREVLPVRRVVRAPADDTFSEDAVIFELGREPTPEEADSISRALDQEAVAVWNGTEGRSYGPFADDWQFDSQWFRLPEGGTLAARAPVEGPAAPAVLRGEGFDRERFAVDYPFANPNRELKLDARKGSEFWGAGPPTPEQAAFAVERARVQADINEGNYTPFFDEGARFHADPSGFSRAGDTMSLRPQRPDALARHISLAQNEDAMGRLANAYERMADNPDANDWYAMGQLQDAIRQEVSPELADMAFRYNFSWPMAATTGGADPTSNLIMSMYGNRMRTLGQPLPASGSDLPYPVGGRYAAGNLRQYDNMLLGGQGITLANPKRHNFAGNFEGYLDRATIDEQMMNIINPSGSGAPPAAAYGVYEEPVHVLAQRYGVTPANLQEVAWAGGKNLLNPRYQPRPMIREVNEMIERTSRLTGTPPEDVFRALFIQGGGMPGYADGGRVGFAVRR